MDLGSILKQHAEAGTKQNAAHVPSLRLPGVARTNAGNDGARRRPQDAGDAAHTEDAECAREEAGEGQQPAMLWPDTPESSPRGHYRQPHPQPLFWMPVPIMMPVMAC